MRRRHLSALQVEVTSRCTRLCAICARTALAERWLDGDFSEELWRRLLPDLGLVRHLHLQGWGEPLLHPGLESMAADAHAAGCRVGITSNGDLLRDAAGWLASGTVDVLALSVAGTDADNLRLRDGVRTTDVLEALAELAGRRASPRRPRLHLSYLLTRDNAGGLEAVVRAAASAGADAVLVSHLDFLPTAELRQRAAWAEGGVDAAIRKALEAAAAAARSRRIELRMPAFEPQEMLTCALDPRQIVSVRWDGRVGPCVMLNLPIDGSVPRCTGDGPLDVEPPVFGNLAEATLSEILDGAGFGSFTEPFRRRMAADARYGDQALTASGWGSSRLAEIDRAFESLERAMADNPFPAACTGCPKASGW
jgi:MoaA/NifB/PqqE/SkfB family radical SAM enzyme